MKKLKHSITIGITDNDQCVVSVTPELEASLALQLLGTLALHLLNAYYQAAQGSLNLADKDSAIALTGIKESMYDAADNVFSSVLAQFYPEAPRMSIEDEAILELTNKLINERYDAMSDEDKAKYSEAYNKTLNSIQAKQAKQVQLIEDKDTTDVDSERD